MKYRIDISLRAGVKDIASEAILKTANGNADLGNNKLQSLSMGKWFIIECDDDFDIRSLCEKLLSNTVIERYEIVEQRDS
jgi:phosphoribosylformylglycinamidine (FGAM) synthase PurS component